MIWLLLAAMPADLAPGAPELSAGESRLRSLLVTTAAVGGATSRLQVAWTLQPRPKPTEPCADAALLEIGWRIERFGAAWREAVQAARAEADRTRRARDAPTVSPLVDARWEAALAELFAETERQERALIEASAWELAWVRPVLAACPVPSLEPRAGVPMTEILVRGEPPLPKAVLGMGDGWVCPGRIGDEDAEPPQRADDGIVLVRAPSACWAANASCGCTPEPIHPGAVLGPEPLEELGVAPGPR